MSRKQQLSLEQRTVNLTAIKVDGSKMTTSVFRQIPEEDIYDEKFKLVGIPWGTINFFWNEARRFNDTVLHVLWQNGEELRRDRFSDVINGHEIHQYSRDNYIKGFTQDLDAELSEINPFLEAYNQAHIQTPNSYFLYHNAIYKKYKLFPPGYYTRCLSRNDPEEHQRAIALAESLEKRKIEIAQQIEKRKSDAETYIAARHRAYQKLTQLPQLYLA